MVSETASYPPKHFLLKTLSNYWTFALLTAGFFTFNRSWNLLTNLSQKPMSCSAYLEECLIINKGRVGLFQILQKERLFISYDNQVFLVVISLLASSKKSLPLPFTWQKQPTRSVVRERFSKITLRYCCSPVNLLYIFRTPFYKNTSWGLFLTLGKKRT